ncbi:D-3-phosphoglycerate dehydrogenase-like isoform X1 [Panicum virgatum]|uniref:D-3-phosphoglycerate dehydrogenase-like isoform X1 n=1 Tax=Panicum virgatum TaxID=38727 RepID=UPI0019D654A9|nr:D-3-phosphoglycerate dehydrogenase-like isoform X1 [Panicum virgatum]
MAGARLASRLTHSPAHQLSRTAAAAAAAAAASWRRRRDSVSLPRGSVSRMSCSVGSSKVTRVLFCGPYFPASTIYTKEYLQSYPFIEVDEVGLEQVPDVIQNYHICVVKNRRIDSDIIAKATQMKIIMQYGVGLEGVDVNAATEHKIKVARIPGSKTGNAVSCAEMAIYLTLGVLRKQKLMDNAVNQKDLGSPTGETIFGKTVLILGFGAIGVEIAKRLKPFGVKILATKRNWSLGSLSCDIEGLVDKKGGPEDMYELAGEADIVITCLLQTSETVGIVDNMFLSVMKKVCTFPSDTLIWRIQEVEIGEVLKRIKGGKAMGPDGIPIEGSYLVNIARGRLLDYKVVFDHLESGHLGGLGIDVAWTEPFDPNDPILKFSNVILTPHVAGVTEYSYRTMAKVVGDVALQLHSGEPFTGIEFVN